MLFISRIYKLTLFSLSRGMAACIGVMVARLSALGGVNVLGAFIMSHCTSMFYVCGGLMLGECAACFTFT